MSDKRALIRQAVEDLENELIALEEADQRRAKSEEKQFSHQQALLDLHQEVGELRGKVEDLPTKAWVYGIQFAAVFLGIAALGAMGAWLRTLLGLLAPDLVVTPPPQTGP